ncbi:MAG: DNA recombination protein RmuC [Proteobacteria bacterium]|nr:DNA recombination protein RmuC [Pseudomonadota bacterium]
MNVPLVTFGSYSFGMPELLGGAGLVLLALFAALLLTLMRASRSRAIEAAATAERQHELDDKVAEMNRLQAEMTGRMQTLAEVFGTRQADLARLISERLDNVRHSMGQSLSDTAQKSADALGKLNERLAVIDAAQADLKGLTSEVLSLKDVLANKQARGAYGQGRMEAIIRDALPAAAYRFQITLSNRARPDCVIDLPGDTRPLVIDAKFPLEGFVALREAVSDEARLAAEKRVKGDLSVHIKDIAEKYLIAGETQDIALLFVPSEAIYAELCEKFDEIIQKSHRARVLIVSPSLLMMAVQVALSIVRDAAVREQARIIQSELGKMLEDVRRLSDRAGKLQQHFRQAQEDVEGILTSADKVDRRAARIESLEFEQPNVPEQEAAPRAETASPLPFRLRNG